MRTTAKLRHSSLNQSKFRLERKPFMFLFYADIQCCKAKIRSSYIGPVGSIKMHTFHNYTGHFEMWRETSLVKSQSALLALL